MCVLLNSDPPRHTLDSQMSSMLLRVVGGWRSPAALRENIYVLRRYWRQRLPRPAKHDWGIV